MQKHPPIPTPEECTSNARLADFDGMPAYACWYPQMGGYVGRCIVTFQPTSEEVRDYCFEAYVWHDGQFPFSDEGTDPVRIHHCMPSQFVRFGAFVNRKQKEHHP